MALQPPGQKARRGRPQRRSTSALVRAAWARAAAITEAEVDAFTPTPDHFELALAVMGGATSVDQLADYSGMAKGHIQRFLAEPVAMAWISRQVAAHFRHRAAFVDAALYTRAITGDVAAIRLFYDRFKLATDEKHISVQYGGSVELRSMSTEDLARIVQDRAQLLPAEFKVLPPNPKPVSLPHGQNPSTD